MALDYVRDHIRVNCLCPGTIDTPSLGQRIAAFPDPVEARKNFIARQPMGRLAPPRKSRKPRSISFHRNPLLSPAWLLPSTEASASRCHRPRLIQSSGRIAALVACPTVLSNSRSFSAAAISRTSVFAVRPSTSSGKLPGRRSSRSLIRRKRMDVSTAKDRRAGLCSYTGHALALGYFGMPSATEEANGMPLHGEAVSAEWKVIDVDASNHAAWLVLEVALPVYRLSFRRELRLRAASSVIDVRETVGTSPASHSNSSGSNTRRLESLSTPAAKLPCFSPDRAATRGRSATKAVNCSLAISSFTGRKCRKPMADRYRSFIAVPAPGHGICGFPLDRCGAARCLPCRAQPQARAHCRLFVSPRSLPLDRALGRELRPLLRPMGWSHPRTRRGVRHQPHATRPRARAEHPHFVWHAGALHHCGIGQCIHGIPLVPRVSTGTLDAYPERHPLQFLTGRHRRCRAGSEPLATGSGHGRAGKRGSSHTRLPALLL